MYIFLCFKMLTETAYPISISLVFFIREPCFSPEQQVSQIREYISQLPLASWVDNEIKEEVVRNVQVISLISSSSPGPAQLGSASFVLFIFLLPDRRQMAGAWQQLCTITQYRGKNPCIKTGGAEI